MAKDKANKPRQQRLAEKLRENLRRRKVQSRARSETDVPGAENSPARKPSESRDK